MSYLLDRVSHMIKSSWEEAMSWWVRLAFQAKAHNFPESGVFRLITFFCYTKQARQFVRYGMAGRAKLVCTEVAERSQRTRDVLSTDATTLSSSGLQTTLKSE